MDARNLYPGKTYNVIYEIRQPNIDLAGCYDVQWSNKGRTIIDNYIISHSGNNTLCELEKYVTEFLSLSDKIALI